MNKRVTDMGICKNCGEKFKLYKKRNGKFCCMSCYKTWRVNNINVAKNKEYQRIWKNENRKKNGDKLRVRGRDNYKKNRDKIIKRNREHYEKNINGYRDKHRYSVLLTKLEIFSHYSKDTFVCAICGEGRLECLSIDHTEGGGCKHRKSIGGISGHRFYLWMKKNNYPDGYRVLCMNCQFIERERQKNDLYRQQNRV